MSTECEPAAAALESINLNVNSEPQKAETVPDSLNLELSSGSEEDRPRAKDDDKSAMSESDISYKKSTIKGNQSHRQLLYIIY